MLMTTQDLAGMYGDIFWDLQSLLQYIAGSEIHCIVSVANITDDDHEYMIMAKVTQQNNIVAQYPVTVNDQTWFSVGARDIASFPGSLKIGYSNAVLSLDLYEKELNDVTDSVQTTLVAPQLPSTAMPEVPTVTDVVSTMVMMMILIMMMTTMSKSIEEKY